MSRAIRRAVGVILCLGPAFVIAADSPRPTANSPSTAGKGDVALKRQIETAWRARQERVRSLTIEWTETRFLRKGTLTLPFPTDDPPVERPPEDETAVVDGIRLTLQGDKARHESESLNSRFLFDGGHKSAVVFAFDGTLATSYYHPRGQSVGNGGLETRSKFADRTSESLLPLCLAFRPLSKACLDLNLNDFEIESSGNLVTLREKKAARKDPRVHDVIVVDSSREFMPVSFTGLFNDRPTYEVTVQHLKAGSEWIPSAWQFKSLDSELLPKRTTEAVVTSHEMNAHFEDSLFRIEFPPGTHIANRDTDEEYTLTSTGTKQHLTNWGEPERLEVKSEWSVAQLALVLAGVLASAALWIAVRRRGQT